MPKISESEKAIKLESLVKETEESLRSLLSEEHNIESEKQGDSYMISGEYNDAYDIESLSLGITVNEFGIPFYILDLDSTDRNNEIIKPESCHECDNFCNLWKRGKCSRTDKVIEREEVNHMNRKKLDSQWLNRGLIIEPKLITEECFLNVTHEHEFKGFALNLKCHDIETVKAVLELRDCLISLYRSV